MPKLFCIFLFVLFASSLRAEDTSVPFAKAVELRGLVTFNGKKLTPDEIIEGDGILTTGRGSYVRLYIKKWQNQILIGPKSSMVLNLGKGVSIGAKVLYLLENGLCRWISDHEARPSNKKVIHTKIAALGVRGTDFLLKANPLLGETEMVVFEGEVQFTNKKNPDDTVAVKKGQWGGLGGRFGDSIGKLVDLPPNVLAVFKKGLR